MPCFTFRLLGRGVLGPGNNKTNRVPNYYIHEADKWLVLPHELQGLTGEEIEHGKGRVADIIRTLREQGHGGN